MRFILSAFLELFFLTGCSSTLHVLKMYTKQNVEWTKDKVHDGAEWVSDKTE